MESALSKALILTAVLRLTKEIYDEVASVQWPLREPLLGEEDVAALVL